MAPQGVLKTVEEDLATEFKDAHVKAHAMQFVGLFVSGFLVALAGARFHVTGWDALAGLALGAAGAAVRQMWPQIPWDTVQSVLGDAKATAAEQSQAPAIPPPPKPTT